MRKQRNTRDIWCFAGAAKALKGFSYGGPTESASAPVAETPVVISTRDVAQPPSNKPNLDALNNAALLVGTGTLVSIQQAELDFDEIKQVQDRILSEIPLDDFDVKLFGMFFAEEHPNVTFVTIAVEPGC